MVVEIYGSFPKLGVLIGGPHNKDCSILGSILGCPCFRKLPYRVWGFGLVIKNLGDML